MTCAVRSAAATPWLSLKASRNGFLLRIAAGRGRTQIELTRKQAQILVERLGAALRRDQLAPPAAFEDPDAWRDPEIL
jgi:hypothetical protein